MNHRKTVILGVSVAAALASFTLYGRAQQQDKAKAQPSAASSPDSPSPHDTMNDMDKSGMHDDSSGSAQSAHDAMGRHMNMGAHMFMTDLRPENAADEKRAEDIVTALRPAIAKYKDYNVALANGFKIFHPEIPQKHYHFTNYAYAFEAQFKFDPARPAALLYKRTLTGYDLEGAMYTAPKRATETQLDERVPLSVARWHKHVNLCLPPKGIPIDSVNRKQFGLDGSIATEEACSLAGGRWIPQIFGWMVHVYPYESDLEKIWAH